MASFQFLYGWSAGKIVGGPWRAAFMFGLAVFLLVGGPWGQPGAAWAGGPPQLEKAKGEACIRPAEWMRRNHMDFLKKQRDLVVREGIRNSRDSLKNCVTCHTSREGFCDRCHAYANVAPVCFECHNYPK